MGALHLEIVVEEPHARHHENGNPSNLGLTRKREVANVGHHPSSKGRDHNGQTSHGGGAGLTHVVLWAKVFLTQNRLSFAAGLKKSNDDARPEHRNEHRGSTRKNYGNHDMFSSRVRAAVRSSKNETVA